MRTQILLLLFFVFFSFKSYAHGDEEHASAPGEDKVYKQTIVDNDGFEVIANGPSQLLLTKINTSYLNNVKKIFSNKCLSCHGINTSLPWYYSIPGPKQLMDYDMSEAKKHMDMSKDFPFGGHGSPIDDLTALKRTLKNESMPPFKYKIMHWGSGLTKEEKKIINEWINESSKLIKNN